MHSRYAGTIKLICISCCIVLSLAWVVFAIICFITEQTIVGFTIILLGLIVDFAYIVTSFALTEALENLARTADYCEILYKATVADTIEKNKTDNLDNTQIEMLRKEIKEGVLNEESEEDNINKAASDECPICFHKISPTDTECSYCGYKLK